MITAFLNERQFSDVLSERKKNRIFIFNFPISLYFYADFLLVDILKCWPELKPMIEKRELKENHFLILKSEHGTLVLFSIINNIEKPRERFLLFKKAFYCASPLTGKSKTYFNLSSFNSFSPAIGSSLMNFLAKSKKKFIVFE